MENKDGLDIAFCAIKDNTLLFSGANNPLWLVRNKQLKELAADKQPIGFHPKPTPFVLHTEQLQKGDTIYLFTDGYADQFGGPKRKKFMYRNFAELIVSLRDKNMDEQKNTLDRTIEEWRGDLEQIDDILIIGIKI